MSQRLQHLVTVTNKLNEKKDIKWWYCDHSSTK